MFSMCFVRNGNCESIHLIAIKDTYTYLGFKVTPPGRFTECINNLIMKAKKAYNCFRFKMSPQTGCPINVLLKVFNSLVVTNGFIWSRHLGTGRCYIMEPTIYYSISWSATIRTPICLIHSANSKVNNIASRREFGMWPFIIPILKSSLKFYMRAKCSDHNFLLNNAFRSQLNIKHSSTVQITFIFIGQTRLVFGKCVCTCVTKHSNAYRTFLNWLKEFETRLA